MFLLDKGFEYQAKWAADADAGAESKTLIFAYGFKYGFLCLSGIWPRGVSAGGIGIYDGLILELSLLSAYGLVSSRPSEGRDSRGILQTLRDVVNKRFEKQTGGFIIIK